MTIAQALQNILELIESEGYQSGDLHDDLVLAITRLREKYPKVASEEL